MKHRFLFMPMIPITLVLAGCSVSTSDGGGGGGGDSGGPVKTQALSGSVNGSPFTAKVALAYKLFADDTGTQLRIYDDAAATCATKEDFPKVGQRYISADIDNFAPGMAYQLDLGHNVTFYTLESQDNLSGNIVLNGRVEVAGSGQQFGLRANGGSAGSVEGQVPLIICQ